MRVSVKDTFYFDPSVNMHERLVSRAERMGLKVAKGFLRKDVTMCITNTTGSTQASLTSAAGGLTTDYASSSEAVATQVVGQSRGRRKDRIHRMLAQAQMGQPTVQTQQPQEAVSSTIADRARELGAMVMSGPAFQRWMRGLEATKYGSGETPQAGKGKAAARPNILAPQCRRQPLAGTDRYKSQEHPRVVIRDLDGLEPDRVQALPPELMRKCILHEDAPPGICPFTPREQWDREVLKRKNKDRGRSGGGKEKALASARLLVGSPKPRRGGWCECCQRQYVGTISAHCAGDEHQAAMAKDPKLVVLLELVNRGLGTSDVDVYDRKTSAKVTREVASPEAAAVAGAGQAASVQKYSGEGMRGVSTGEEDRKGCSVAGAACEPSEELAESAILANIAAVESPSSVPSGRGNIPLLHEKLELLLAQSSSIEGAVVAGSAAINAASYVSSGTRAPYPPTVWGDVDEKKLTDPLPAKENVHPPRAVVQTFPPLESQSKGRAAAGGSGPGSPKVNMSPCRKTPSRHTFSPSQQQRHQPQQDNPARSCRNRTACATASDGGGGDDGDRRKQGVGVGGEGIPGGAREGQISSKDDAAMDLDREAAGQATHLRGECGKRWLRAGDCIVGSGKGAESVACSSSPYHVSSMIPLAITDRTLSSSHGPKNTRPTSSAGRFDASLPPQPRDEEMAFNRTAGRRQTEQLVVDGSTLVSMWKGEISNGRRCRGSSREHAESGTCSSPLSQSEQQKQRKSKSRLERELQALADSPEYARAVAEAEGTGSTGLKTRRGSRVRGRCSSPDAGTNLSGLDACSPPDRGSSEVARMPLCEGGEAGLRSIRRARNEDQVRDTYVPECTVVSLETRGVVADRSVSVPAEQARPKKRRGESMFVDSSACDFQASSPPFGTGDRKSDDAVSNSGVSSFKKRRALRRCAESGIGVYSNLGTTAPAASSSAPSSSPSPNTSSPLRAATGGARAGDSACGNRLENILQETLSFRAEQQATTRGSSLQTSGSRLIGVVLALEEMGAAGGLAPGMPFGSASSTAVREDVRRETARGTPHGNQSSSSSNDAATSPARMTRATVSLKSGSLSDVTVSDSFAVSESSSRRLPMPGEAQGAFADGNVSSTITRARARGRSDCRAAGTKQGSRTVDHRRNSRHGDGSYSHVILVGSNSHAHAAVAVAERTGRLARARGEGWEDGGRGRGRGCTKGKRPAITALTRSQASASRPPAKRTRTAEQQPFLVPASVRNSYARTHARSD